MSMEKVNELAKEYAHDYREMSEEALEDGFHLFGKEVIAIGRLSVLQDFDIVCKADGFVGFTDNEWQAVRKFFRVNREISNWDK